MVAVIALLFTMTTAVSAATLEFANITVSVTPSSSTGKETIDAQCVFQKHAYGYADTVSYSLAASDAHRELNTNLETDYLSYVLLTYDEVSGYHRSVAVPANGTVTIPTAYASGVYKIQATYTYGKPTWEVIQNSNGAVLEVGLISKAPISMSMSAVLA